MFFPFLAVILMSLTAVSHVVSFSDANKNILKPSEQKKAPLGMTRDKRRYQQQEIPKKIPSPRSCLDHLRNGEDKRGGRDLVITTPGGSQTVHCDLTSESGSAWTLVLSYRTKYSHEDQLAPFRKPLNMDVPVNEKTPNTYMYRMTHAQMSYLKNQSSHWRVTCNGIGVNYNDYLRAKMSDFDPLTFIGDDVCKKVELINVRGHVGIGVTAAFRQIAEQQILHHDSSVDKCEFGSSPGFTPDEDNFGYYESINFRFSCSQRSGSTSLWFGGYL